MARSKKPKIALVDPIRTARCLPEELTKRSIEHIVVNSGLVGEGSSERIEHVAERLAKEKVTYVIGCVDPSMMYVDELRALLGVVSNGTRLSEARRNKTRMNEVIRRAGLRAPRSFETAEKDQLVRWARRTGYPVVVKPVASGGSDDVYLCESEAELTVRFEAMLGKTNLMGTPNTSVLVQEFVDGTEYAIDCVSFDGFHAVIDHFAYQKGTHNGRAFIYEKEFYLRSEDPIGRRLRAFAYRALDALEFRTGASHMEVKLDSRDELVFIEVAARMNGGDTYEQVRDARADGKGQLDYVIEAALGLPPPDPDHFETAKDCLRTYIVSTKEGVVRELLRLEQIKALRSFCSVHLALSPGAKASRTTDLTNPAGWVDLSNADANALAADEKALDDIVASGILVVQ